MRNDINLLKKAEFNQMPISLYGAGKYGRIALKNIKRMYPDINITCFIDDDLIRNGNNVEGIQILSLENALQKIGDGIIVISNYYITETLKKLDNAEADLSRVFFSNEILIEPIAKEYIHEKKEELTEVYWLLEDYESKIIYKTMIESRFNHNIDILSRTCRAGQYFPTDIFQFTDNEVFVDGGAFDGDTINNFLKVTNGKYKYIYAFEPDDKNYHKLTYNHRNTDIRLFQAGLYHKKGTLAFCSGKGGSSQIIENGSNTVEVHDFDSLEVPDKNISFVKLDIEGSELCALQGMEKTIRRCKPKLAICIYHKFEDLWEIPFFIRQLVPEYRFYIRNYTTYLDEIVLYATV